MHASSNVFPGIIRYSVICNVAHGSVLHLEHLERRERVVHFRGFKHQFYMVVIRLLYLIVLAADDRGRGKIAAPVAPAYVIRGILVLLYQVYETIHGNGFIGNVLCDHLRISGYRLAVDRRCDERDLYLSAGAFGNAVKVFFQVYIFAIVPRETFICLGAVRELVRTAVCLGRHILDTPGPYPLIFFHDLNDLVGNESAFLLPRLQGYLAGLEVFEHVIYVAGDHYLVARAVAEDRLLCAHKSIGIVAVLLYKILDSIHFYRSIGHLVRDEEFREGAFRVCLKRRSVKENDIA